MTEKPELNYEHILNNFDEFCDDFESRAANAFLRGDQNDGRVISKSEEIGTGTPDVVREVHHTRAEDIPARAAVVTIPTTIVE